MNIWSTLVDLSMRKHFILKLFWCFWRHIQPLLVNKCWPESSYFFPGWKVWYQGFQMPCQLYSEDSYIKRYDFLKFHFFLKIRQILCYENAFLLWKMLLNMDYENSTIAHGHIWLLIFMNMKYFETMRKSKDIYFYHLTRFWWSLKLARTQARYNAREKYSILICSKSNGK